MLYPNRGSIDQYFKHVEASDIKHIPGRAVVHEAHEHPADPPEELASLPHQGGAAEGGSLQVLSTLPEFQKTGDQSV